jgi:hypothetical protein
MANYRWWRALKRSWVPALAAIVTTTVLSLVPLSSPEAIAAPKAPAPVRPAIASATAAAGYWLMTGFGTIKGFNAPMLGDPASVGADTCVNDGTVPLYACTGLASTPTGGGYWISSGPNSPPFGAVFIGFGNATLVGTPSPFKATQPVVGVASTPSGHGLWQVAADGGVFSFGDAKFYGSAGNVKLVKPIVGMAATPDGRGYYLVAADGGVFTYGDAKFYGSAGNVKLVKPVVGMAAPDAGGYWLVASDGGVFSYGDAPFRGSWAGQTLDSPVVAIAAKG